MINLIIKDGLGNQLFEYAYARYLQYLYCQKGQRESITINPYYIDNFDFRKVALHHFRLNENVTFLEHSEQKKNMNEFKKRIVYANGTDILFWKLFKTKKPIGEPKYLKRSKKGLYYTYTPQTEYKTILSEAKEKFVFGCFQSESNFRPISKIIKNEFTIKTPASIENTKMLKYIAESNSVCLHIRRGDYLESKWKNLQVCTYEYYNRAINEILKCESDPVFFVFSNTHEDLEWIKKNYHFTNYVNCKKIKFVYVDLSNPDYEELRLMQNCKHLIISNSTFSWWAAYLAPNKDKKVLVPERWNLAIEDDSSIYLDSWKKIPI
ncbi:alpha-1,2-fucosyltransferase [Blautia sp.]|uniref:alpha-1,2-fucosyltransferase n=1 Tax=Blautia sp. TaxID=1955243 RepID=UPI003AB478D9